MKVLIASDHAGLQLKASLLEALADAKVDHQDLGPSAPDSVDYPDFAQKVARAVAGQNDALGVLVCGSGIGMSIAANKVKGVRAALCRTELEAKLARQHNDANVLCLGERITGQSLARAILEAFLSARFEGGRHQRRVDKMEPAP